MRRTVNISFNPRPLRPITIPLKIWIRSLSPSTTRVCTWTLSPTANFVPSAFCCSFSIASMMRFIAPRLLEGADILPRSDQKCKREDVDLAFVMVIAKVEHEHDYKHAHEMLNNSR